MTSKKPLTKLEQDCKDAKGIKRHKYNAALYDKVLPIACYEMSRCKGKEEGMRCYLMWSAFIDDPKFKEAIKTFKKRII